MSENKGISLVDVGDVSKPVDTLIHKISDAIGAIFKPCQIKRIAKAEAQAALTKANADIQIEELNQRAMQRFIEEQMKHQANIESVTSKAICQLKDKANPEHIDNDWLANFFDKCRIISDDEMQNLWSRILAGEANAPGTYSRRTVSLISDLDQKDARLFKALCRFIWTIDEVIPLIYNLKDPIYTQNMINFDNIRHLESIGLIKFEGIGEFTSNTLSQHFIASYFGKNVKICFKDPQKTQLNIGRVLFTQAGQELTSVCDPDPVYGFIDYVKLHWKDHLPQ